MRRIRKLQTELRWKIMASYLIVVVVSVITLMIAAEAAIPTAFRRHMLSMQAWMAQSGSSHEMQSMAADLFGNFRVAVTEAMLVSSAVGLLTALLLSIFVSRLVVNPVGQMMHASRRIAAGNYRERVTVSGEDELARLATSFNQMAATLEQTETMRRNLIADVAHELRTPLASIKGYMEGLMDGVLPTNAETYQLVYSEAERLERLVHNLHELSQVEAGAFSLSRQPTNINQVIEQVITRLRPQFDEKALDIHLELDRSLPAVSVDSDMISQVLINLVGNALQYTPSGGRVVVSSTLVAEKHSLPGIQVCVRDNGIGLATADQPHIFTRFYRVDRSRSRVGGGSGIGLTIVKHLVEAHQGQVWVDSPGLGQGSTFGFVLPIRS